MSIHFRMTINQGIYLIDVLQEKRDKRGRIYRHSTARFMLERSYGTEPMPDLMYVDLDSLKELVKFLKSQEKTNE